MTHHAYLLTSPHERARSYVRAQFPESSPDITWHEYTTLSIDDARAIIHEASMRPLQNPERAMILIFHKATSEAQNALLKLFEDPPGPVRFYVLWEHAFGILPTLRSRLLELAPTDNTKIDSQTSDEPHAVAETFLKKGYAARLEEIAARTKAKDTAWIEALLTGIEHYAEHTTDTRVLRDSILSTTYSKDTGASHKMLLEHLALSLSVQT